MVCHLSNGKRHSLRKQTNCFLVSVNLTHETNEEIMALAEKKESNSVSFINYTRRHPFRYRHVTMYTLFFCILVR